MSIQQGVREAITVADELSRTAHEQHHEPLAQALDSVRSTLMRIDAAIGGNRTAVPLLRDLARTVDHLAAIAEKVAPEMRQTVDAAIQTLRGFHGDLRLSLTELAPSLEIPSKPLFGVLPLARFVSQDVHSLTDYASGALSLGTAIMADSTEARFAGAALGGSAIAVAALTDCRLSAAKVIPIEAHEAIDHLWGAAAIAAPFVLGYWKKEPAVAALQILAGASTILTSLFTDYRAARGVGRSDEEIAQSLALAE